MELTELSTQLKTFDLVGETKRIPVITNECNPFGGVSRRLTRSQTLPNNGLQLPVSEFPIQKTPKKEVFDSEDEVREIYLNNKVKVVHKNLETIFEDPVLKRGNIMFHSAGKQKRSICLCREFRIISKTKSKIRKTMIRHLGKKPKPSKMTHEEFKEKMLQIENYLNDNSEEPNTIEDQINVDGGNSSASYATESPTEMETQ